MYDINIVANHPTIQKFRSLKDFKLDLGKSLIDAKAKQISIEDKFLAFQVYKLERMVYKIGTLGKVSFYYDNKIIDDKVEIYFDTTKFDKELTTFDVDNWLSESLVEIEQQLETAI